METERRSLPTLGRPTQYDPEAMLAPAATCAAEGKSLAHIADRLGVSRKTVVRWRAQYPQFRAAIDDGWAAAADQVESSLLRLALGYTYEEREVRSGGSGETVVVRTRTARPDYRAIALWLANCSRGEGPTRPRIPSWVDPPRLPATATSGVPAPDDEAAGECA